MAGVDTNSTGDECVSKRVRSGDDDVRWVQSVIRIFRNAMRKRYAM